MVDAVHRGGERLPSATSRPRSSGCSAATSWRGPRRPWRWRPRRSRECGFEPRYISTGGGSDANALVAARPARAERGQRHGARPPARRERHGRGARADARRDARARAAATGARAIMRRRFERVSGEMRLEGRSPPCASTATATRTARRRSGRWSCTPARWRSWPWTGSGVPRTPAAGGRGRGAARAARRESSTRTARSRSTTAKRELAEEIGKGAAAGAT